VRPDDVTVEQMEKIADLADRYSFRRAACLARAET